MNGIADTGFLVAFANRDDEHHDWAKGIASQVREPLLTCEAVLAETAFHLSNTKVTLEMLKDGLITLAFNCSANLPHLEALAERYEDRRPDFADLCLVRLSELHPHHSVITTDNKDFRVYRRNRREVIPLICPPNR